jgi:hypothetical protein
MKIWFIAAFAKNGGTEAAPTMKAWACVDVITVVSPYPSGGRQIT